METRKIQQVGGGTYTVSLPKEWATAADIEPGSVVALHSHIDGTLVVQTGVDEADAAPSLTLSVADADPCGLEHTLRAAYAAGIDAVELDVGGVTDDAYRLVERVTRDLTGVTVTESTEGTLQVRSLLDVEEVSITQSVRQLQFAALSAHRDATAALTAPATADGTVGDDRQSARIFAMVDHYVQRGIDSLAVMDALGLTRPSLFVRWVTARELDRIADQAGRIATVADRLDAPPDSEIDELADRARSLVRDAVGVVLDDAAGDTPQSEAGPGPTTGRAAALPDSAQTAAARRILDDCDQLRTDIEAFDRRLFEADGADYRLTHALDSLRRTADSAETIADAGLRSLLRAHPSSTPLELGAARDA